AGVRLSRTSAHRKALFSNLIAALFTHERIRTTDAKAKETRRLAERTITWARRLGDVLGKKPERRSLDESARYVHAVRMARRVVRDRGAVLRLFEDLAPRAGDAAPMALLELLPEDEGAAKPAAKDDKGGGKGGEKAAKGGEGKGAKAQAKGAEKAPPKKAAKK